MQDPLQWLRNWAVDASANERPHIYVALGNCTRHFRTELAKWRARGDDLRWKDARRQLAILGRIRRELREREDLEARRATETEERRVREALAHERARGLVLDVALKLLAEREDEHLLEAISSAAQRRFSPAERDLVLRAASSGHA